MITGEFGIYSQISAYLKEISRNTSELKFLNPYGGRDGQLILTAVSPVHSWCSGEMVGVVGVDYSLEDVQSVLSRARSESSYAFIVNQFGEVQHEHLNSHCIRHPIKLCFESSLRKTTLICRYSRIVVSFKYPP